LLLDMYVLYSLSSSCLSFYVRKGGTVQIFGNDYNKSKPDSGGN
jgi:hypothetical protein